MLIEFKNINGVRHYRLGPTDRWKVDNLTQEQLDRLEKMEDYSDPRIYFDWKELVGEERPAPLPQRPTPALARQQAKREEDHFFRGILSDLCGLLLHMLLRLLIVIFIAGIIYTKTEVPEGENPFAYFAQEYLTEEGENTR